MANFCCLEKLQLFHSKMPKTCTIPQLLLASLNSIPTLPDAKTRNMNRYNVDGWEQCVIDSQYLLSALTLSKSTLVQSFSTHFLKGTWSWHKLIQIIKQNNRRLIPSSLKKHLLPLLLNRFNSFSCKKSTIQSLNTPCNLSLCHFRTTNKPASKTLNATTAA